MIIAPEQSGAIFCEILETLLIPGMEDGTIKKEQSERSLHEKDRNIDPASLLPAPHRLR